MLFDFDGPVCDVFAEHPAHDIALSLAGLISRDNAALGAKAQSVTDPMEVLRISQQCGDHTLSAVEEALTEEEVRAVRLVEGPVQGARLSLESAHSSGRKVAIVSNNSVECVTEFLALHDLQGLVHEVIGRPYRRPDLMKPAPHSINLAAESLRSDRRKSVLIGDSVTDIEAAHSAEALAVGFANAPQKVAAMREAHADAVVTDMAAVGHALAATSWRP
ncbi:HAD family hydrolase [Streptomyces buecherae]|uniref:HAD family hydrolase n=1 Tax=Streptomyces buecherae TaxID=2763006 RepID=UPI0027E231EC|nr:HAD hydrolase-like protein [Streptomyces buecherae]